MVFKQEVLRLANTGELLTKPDDLDDITAGNIMADVASELINQGQDIKAIIVLNERQRLGI